jgi:hypothetical protein
MKKWLSIFLGISLLYSLSCTKEDFVRNKEAQVRFTTDTLFFDTVFTSVGSITKGFKIVNENEGKLLLSNVRLMGGAASAYKINVDGAPGDNFNNVEIDTKDSIWVFATVSINPTNANTPFIVRDSIKITYNDSTRFVQLQALGANANFYSNVKRISRDTTFTNNRPYVFIKGLVVDSGYTLTVNEGCRMFFNASAPVVVNGSLRMLGKKFDSTQIVLRGDRLDEPYKDYPASWPGMVFSRTSRDNVLDYTIIKNAYQGIVIADPPSSGTNPKLLMRQCIIDNMFDAGLYAYATTVRAENCLFLNNGTNQGSYNVQIEGGGTYSFEHCNIIGFSNFYLKKNSVLGLSNQTIAGSATLNAIFKNCIIYGEGTLPEDEMIFRKIGSTAYQVNLTHVLYKQKTVLPTTYVTALNCPAANQNPKFDSVSTGRRYYDLHFTRFASPALNVGASTTLSVDLDGKPRVVGSSADLGCYEKQ